MIYLKFIHISWFFFLLKNVKLVTKNLKENLLSYVWSQKLPCFDQSMSAQIWTPLVMVLSSYKLYIYEVSYLKFIHISNFFFLLKNIKLLTKNLKENLLSCMTTKSTLFWPIHVSSNLNPFSYGFIKKQTIYLWGELFQIRSSN